MINPLPIRQRKLLLPDRSHIALYLGDEVRRGELLKLPLGLMTTID